MMNQRKNPGFTLIELMLVMVILVVLAAVVVPKFTNRSEQAREAAAKTDIRNIETALSTFEIDNGRFPSADEGLAALFEEPQNARSWKGPYLMRGMPKDPWGTPYVYRYPATISKSGYDLLSCGPDRREGGDDDIGNWSND
jgi:general secretion pathway protein G